MKEVKPGRWVTRLPPGYEPGSPESTSQSRLGIPLDEVWLGLMSRDPELHLDRQDSSRASPLHVVGNRPLTVCHELIHHLTLLMEPMYQGKGIGSQSL